MSTESVTENVTENFEGHPNRDCGEHRTVGAHRAWCYDCSEWCYPTEGCKGCKLPALEAEVDRLRFQPDWVADLDITVTVLEEAAPDSAAHARAMTHLRSLVEKVVHG